MGIRAIVIAAIVAVGAQCGIAYFGYWAAYQAGRRSAQADAEAIYRVAFSDGREDAKRQCAPIAARFFRERNTAQAELAALASQLKEKDDVIDDQRHRLDRLAQQVYRLEGR